MTDPFNWKGNDPTPAEIRAMCSVIRKEWADKLVARTSKVARHRYEDDETMRERRENEDGKL